MHDEAAAKDVLFLAAELEASVEEVDIGDTVGTGDDVAEVGERYCRSGSLALSLSPHWPEQTRGYYPRYSRLYDRRPGRH
jgi:hypothetical protein